LNLAGDRPDCRAWSIYLFFTNSTRFFLYLLRRIAVEQDVAMSRFREGKIRLAALCAREGWKKALESEITDPVSARRAVNPLLALLARPELRLRAAYGLGRAVSLLAEQDREAARVVLRRLMWSLNEESGNLGWGVPEAMGCILAESPALAAEYSRIFLSYGYETGNDDNFLEHPPLRLGVFLGIGILAKANPEAAGPALPRLVQALADENRSLRGMAAFALRQLAEAVPDAEFLPGPESGAESGTGRRALWLEASAALDRAGEAEKAEGGAPEMVQLLDGETEKQVSTADLPASAAAVVRRRLRRVRY
jgi:hypothetical protein